jgi:hypothetical protein
MTDDSNGKPKSIAQSGVADDVVGNIYGVDTNETAAQDGKLTHAGWVKRTSGTGGRAGRVFQEVLVAASSIGSDAEDVKYPDALISITSQPSSKSVAAPAATTFTVAASTTSGTLTFQWQVDTGGGFGNVSGSPYSGETTATLAISDSSGLDTYEYRCVVSVTGADDVNSSAATLTVT